MKYIIIAIILIIAYFIITIVTKMNNPEDASVITRFLLGHHLDGKRRTNATFFKRADTIMHPTGRASKYAHLSHFEIALIRWVSVIFIGSLSYGLYVSSTLTIISFTLASVIAIALNGKRIERKYVNRHVTRGIINPLSMAIATLWQTTPQLAQNAITINKDYAKSKGMDRIGIIILPDWYQASDMQRDQFKSLLHMRLGIDLDIKWNTSSHPMTVELFRAPSPPALVTFAEKKSVMDSLDDSKVLLGVTGRNEDVYWDMKSEEPHLATQATSRRGKTRLLLLIAAQILNKGGSVYCLDPKRVGVKDALSGHPNAYVWDNPRDVQGSWDIIQQFKELLDSRIDQYEEDRTVQFKRSLLIIDEMSMWTVMTKRHWDKVRGKKKGKAEIWDIISEILWTAAFVKQNMLIFGQRLDMNMLNGLLESFGTRLAAGFTRQSYMRFIGLSPVPASPKSRGRFIYSDTETATPIQCVLGNDLELNDYARKGIVKPTLDEIIEINNTKNTLDGVVISTNEYKAKIEGSRHE